MASQILLVLCAFWIICTLSYHVHVIVPYNVKHSNHNTVYIIRHGEKPKDGSHGLSDLGHKRAECIQNLFGPQSNMNISYIIAAPTSNRARSSRSIDTVKPLAKALGLDTDSYCAAGDARCVTRKIHDLQKAHAEDTSPFNILIVGRHTKIQRIAKALGVKKPPKYPDEYGLTWEIQNGQLNVSHQRCPEMDDQNESLLDDVDENGDEFKVDSDHEHGSSKMTSLAERRRSQIRGNSWNKHHVDY